MLGQILSTIFGFLLRWYIWIPIVAVLLYFTWRNNQRAKQIQKTDAVLLVLEIPRTNDRKELAAEQLFASLHGILRDRSELKSSGGVQEHISFEIASINNMIRFYIWTPKHLQNFVEGQVYAQYPTVQIHQENEDYTRRHITHTVVNTAELTLTEPEVLPIKCFESFEVDPLAGITATLAKVEGEDEELWIQVLARPIPDTWHKKASQYAEKVKNGSSFGFGGGGGGALKFVGGLLGALWKPPEAGVGGTGTVREISERDKTRISEVDKKSTKLGYQVKIRIAYLGHNQTIAHQRIQGLVGTFKQFNSTNLNGFRLDRSSFKREDIAAYAARHFVGNGYILNIEELASVYHLPHTNVETPNIVWASVKTAEPPAKLPAITGNQTSDAAISAFGITNFRGVNYQFGLLRSDRGRHTYIIGQTGTGKSGLLELFALSDIYHNHGYAIIDPHGDFAVNNLRLIPPSRQADVVYFNPADTAFPLGFNPMEVHDPSMKSNTSSEIIGVLKRMFGDSWGPRLEYILRYTILALLDYPGSTMLDITRMLTDKKFRKKVLEKCNDNVVLNFWNVEFASWNDKFASEAVAPVLNKVGAFTANPIIRNIIGQPKSTFNIRHLMDEGKILIVNLSKGLIGEDNAGILGAFLVTKIQLAAMSRSDIPNIEDRLPFYLYVDEFQNFATDSFATILSEARKYGLNLTVANQYVSQMEDTVRDAVFGNVGTMISFRVSGDDAPVLAKSFAPQFEPEDLLSMANRHFIITMVIDGEKVPAFSAKTLALPPVQADNLATIVAHSRQQYARGREEVEAEIQAVLSSSQQTFMPTAANKPSMQAYNQPVNPEAGVGKKRSRNRSRNKKAAPDASAQTPAEDNPNTDHVQNHKPPVFESRETHVKLR